MVRITLRKTNNFVFKTWAISRTTLCLHRTRIHRGAVQILGDQRMNLRSGVRLAALDLRKSWKSPCRQYLRRKCAEWQCRIIAPLRRQRFPVDRTSLQSWRRASFLASKFKAQLFERSRNSNCSSFPNTTTFCLRFASMHQRTHESSGRQHRRARFDSNASICINCDSCDRKRLRLRQRFSGCANSKRHTRRNG